MLKYLSFINHAYNGETKTFHNYFSYKHEWIESYGNDDVFGRTIWALGTAVVLAPNESVLSFATRLFLMSVGEVVSLNSPRGWAFSLLGISAYLEKFTGDTLVRRLRGVLAKKLIDSFNNNSSKDWPWNEEVVTYANAKLPHALILCGRSLSDDKMLKTGLSILEWLVNLQLDQEGNVSLIGNNGWFNKDGTRGKFDQQPIEAAALIEASVEAYFCTKDTIWKKRAMQFLGWYLGKNDINSMLYNPTTGGCRDGLHSDGPNLNEGAESTLAWLMSVLSIQSMKIFDESTL